MRAGRVFAVAVTLMSSGLSFGCVTSPSVKPIHFYVSWNGDDPATGALTQAVDTQMRAEPGFISDFDDPIDVNIGSSISNKDEIISFPVSVQIVSRIAGYLIPRSDRRLDNFEVTCLSSEIQHCVRDVVKRVARQSARIDRLVRKSRDINMARKEAPAV